MGSKTKASLRKPIILSFFILSLTLMLLKHNYFSMQLKFESEIPRNSYSHVSQIDQKQQQQHHPRWYTEIANELSPERRMRVGLVNIDEEGSKKIEFLLKGEQVEIVKVQFEPVDGDGDDDDSVVQWRNLFPDWINESNPQKQDCPDIPMPEFKDYGELDVIVANVPCSAGNGSGGNRDVLRLQVNLVVANMLVRSSGDWKEEKVINHKGENDQSFIIRTKYVVFMGSSSSCGPMMEIFRCDDLLWQEGIWSLYRPDLRRLRQKLMMPVGACKLAPPFAAGSGEKGREGYEAREAYVTILHSSEAYVCGAIALAQSIIKSNSTKDLVLLADDHISAKSFQGLIAAGWKIKRIKRIRSSHARKDAYNEWNYTKLRIWQLTQYDKVMFIDSDLLVLRNLDDYFQYPQISAVWNDMYLFNSGLMLIEPSECTFQTLMSKRFSVDSYNGGDQGFLNEVFTWWHRWPAQLNSLKFFEGRSDEQHNIQENSYAIHYLGLKPWMCYEDYDCNWDIQIYQKFASDSAHKKWWQIYDTMPQKLRPFCDLTPKMEARIEKWRAKAEIANFPDGHWKIKVKDRRRRRRKRRTE